jgi:hypothetical protein
MSIQNQTKTDIDITPNFKVLMPAIIATLRNPNASFDSIYIVTEELNRIAGFFDKYKKVIKFINENIEGFTPEMAEKLCEVLE